MFKSPIAFLLILALMTSNFSRLFIYAGFELNKTYIATTLCENKDMPELNCDGQCYLAKKIKQAQEKEESDTQQVKKGNYQEAFLTEKIVLNAPSQENINMVNVEILFHLPKKHTSIFHPPKV